MDKEIASIHHKQKRSKYVVYAIVGFLALLTYILVIISGSINNTQQAFNTQTNAQVADVIKDQPADACTGVGCNSICDPAWGMNCLPGLTCTQVASGRYRCRSTKDLTRADCGYDGSGECGSECDPSQGKNCRAGLVCVDDESGKGVCAPGQGMECPRCPKGFTYKYGECLSMSGEHDCAEGFVWYIDRCVRANECELDRRCSIIDGNCVCILGPTPTPVACNGPHCSIIDGNCVCIAP